MLFMELIWKFVKESALFNGRKWLRENNFNTMPQWFNTQLFEGTLTGEILYEGVPVNKMEQYELSRKIGTVFQDPRSQFFAVNTTDEVAFGCENLAFSTERINQNVDAAFSRMNIDVLRDRSLFGLSSGENSGLHGCFYLCNGYRCHCFGRTDGKP